MSNCLPSPHEAGPCQVPAKPLARGQWAFPSKTSSLESSQFQRATDCRNFPYCLLKVACCWEAWMSSIAFCSAQRSHTLTQKNGKKMNSWCENKWRKQGWVRKHWGHDNLLWACFAASGKCWLCCWFKMTLGWSWKCWFKVCQFYQ